MDPFRAGREGEEELFGILWTEDGGAEAGGGEDGGAEDGSQFLNHFGPGMEPERREEAETSTECDDSGLEYVGPPEVY
jgi:hypothetical protein